VILANDCNPERVEIARALANGLSALGIYTKVYELPQDEYFSRLGDGDFDLYIGGVVLSNHAPFDFLFSSGGLFLHNAPTLEAAYAMRLAYTEAGYRDATARFQTVFAQQAPVVGIAFRHTALLTGARIRTTEAPTTCDIFRGAHAWQVSP
jgi:ABC-type transport system substrate-binding protein